MTRERISRLSKADLIKLAERLSLDPFDEFDIDEDESVELNKEVRIELEEQVFDLLEESRVEMRNSDSLPVSYHQKHFLSIEEFFGYPIEDESAFFTFPDQYNVTRIMLMLRDPEWAYSYWDISNQDRARITARPDFVNFLIILKEFGDKAPAAEEEPENESIGPRSGAGAADAATTLEMRIPVKDNDNNWYINIPRRHRSYFVELAAEFQESIEILARSGLIRVPGGNFSKDIENINSHESEVLIALSGIEDLGVSAFEGSPRKIVELLGDED